MSGCVRCGEPIKQGKAYHTKRVDDIDVCFHAYDCTQKGSQRLNSSSLFKNGAVVCPCGEPLLAEKMPTVLDAVGSYKCPVCTKVYEIPLIFAYRKPGKIMIANKLYPQVPVQPTIPLRIPMPPGLERF